MADAIAHMGSSQCTHPEILDNPFTPLVVLDAYDVDLEAEDD